MMKSCKRLAYLLLCVILTLSLAACGEDPVAQTTAPQTTAPTTQPEPSAAEVYAQAKQPVQAASNLVLQITVDKTITVGLDTFTSTSNQTLTYADIGTEQFRASLDETLLMGFYSDTFEEFYSDGTMYTTVYDEYHFKGALPQEEFTSRFVPAVLLDETLYSDITASEGASTTTLTFTGATAAEGWALPENAELKEATGTALISSEGRLLKTTYSISYAYGATDVSLEYEVFPTVEDVSSIAEPEAGIEYTEIESVLAPRLLDSAVMAMLNTEHMSTSITEVMVVQAAGLMLSQRDVVDMHGIDDDMLANVDLSISQVQQNSSESYHQVENYQGGVYSITIDDGEPSAQSGVDASVIYDYCMQALGDITPPLDNITELTATDLGGIMYLELRYNDEYADAWQDYVCDTIFSDPDLLNNHATAYETTAAECYFAVDLYTGLPTAMGVNYSGTHTIDGYPYVVSCQVDQSMCLGTHEAYEEITGERPEMEEPENKATPLFYHVTGPDGQEMWLFGTIHIGDERTSFLPQEIYDAFDASDALAVEFNTRAFEENADDPEIQEMVSKAYFYTDGTITQDHVDKELYDTALKYIKASGSYHMNMPYMKVSMWANAIDNFYLQQYYRLRPFDGMDNQLLIRAEKMGKPIWDVESAELQINMMTSYSDELQELLLEQAIEYSMWDNQVGTAELYELWCKGDEEAMRQELTTDTSEMTEEEKQLYDEYTKAMETDRNAGMLEVAKQYLESGDVVFYAVGLAHLLAEDGLVNTLRDAGYTVELVSFS